MKVCQFHFVLKNVSVETQNELQKKIDTLRADCAKSDKQISACQIQLRKAEVLLVSIRSVTSILRVLHCITLVKNWAQWQLP